MDIKLIRDGIEPTIVVINGFLSESTTDVTDWLSVVDELHPSNRVMHFNWPSSSIYKLLFKAHGASFLSFISKNITASNHMNSLPYNIVSDWTLSLENARKAGKWLADYIEKNERTFILMGHSLGARVAYHALSDIKSKNSISSILLFGGAISKTESWNDIYDFHPDLIMTNCYSDNDLILKYLYRAGTLFSNTPIGLEAIDINDKSFIYNVDLSHVVDGHTDYKLQKVGICIASRTKICHKGAFTALSTEKAHWRKRAMWKVKTFFT